MATGPFVYVFVDFRISCTKIPSELSLSPLSLSDDALLL
jgi:hypothetical protein